MRESTCGIASSRLRLTVPIFWLFEPARGRCGRTAAVIRQTRPTRPEHAGGILWDFSACDDQLLSLHELWTGDAGWPDARAGRFSRMGVKPVPQTDTVAPRRRA